MVPYILHSRKVFAVDNLGELFEREDGIEVKS